VGIDGSGKTTQAHRLASALDAAGVPARYVQNAGGRHWFGRLAHRVGLRDGQSFFGRRGMLVVEAVLRWMAIARTRVLSRFRRDVAVMDRYAVCQYASIRAHRAGRSERLARLAYGLFRAPDVTFFLAVDPAEAYARVEARGTDQESMGYLVAADAAYRSLPEFASFVVVDANGTPDEVAAALLGYLLAPAAQARPYTGMAAPLVGADSSPARNRITDAISAGGTHRE
jgi:dTMP kinase